MVLPPLEAIPKEPFFDSQDSMVTVGGRCFELDPVKPEAAIFDFRDFGCDLAGCEAIDAHVVLFDDLSIVRDAARENHKKKQSTLLLSRKSNQLT